MNKRDLLLLATPKANGRVTQSNIQLGFDLMIESILEALSKGGKITIANFGTFYVKEMKERMGRNPQTGEEVKIKARKIIKFKSTANKKIG
ncbi:MAG: HU family DNA-binding protein [Prevotella sp.]|jgi:DNA-binding protein HU-beta|nr:HU family DNA-binding protein [Prevotella sp.]